MQMTDKGEMMTKGEYMAWATSSGKATWLDAEATWSAMEADESIHRDKVGVHTRMRIHIKDEVDFVNTFAAKKTLDLQGATVKRPDTAGIRRLAKGVVADHGLLLEDTGMDLGQVGQGMIAAAPRSSGGSFMEKSQLIPNIRDLLDHEAGAGSTADTSEAVGGAAASKDSAGGAAESEVGDESQAGEEATSSKAGTGTYFLADRAIAAAQSGAKAQVAALTISVSKALVRLKTCLGTIEGTGDDAQKALSKEIVLLKNRFEFLEAVSSETRTKLDCCIRHTEQLTAANAGGKEASESGQSGQFLPQSPIKSPMELMTLRELSAQLVQCTTHGHSVLSTFNVFVPV